MLRLALLLLPVSILVLPASAQDAAPPPPCLADDARRAFDFWVGDWEVTTAGGQLAGHNRIARSLDGCLLVEHWTGVAGSAGSSFNHVDPATGEWHQLWVDAAGGYMDYRGRFVDTALHLEGTWVQADGTSSAMRMTFTPREDGSVRQFIEQSVDGGSTWTTWFDGIYTRTDP